MDSKFPDNFEIRKINISKKIIAPNTATSLSLTISVILKHKIILSKTSEFLAPLKF